LTFEENFLFEEILNEIGTFEAAVFSNIRTVSEIYSKYLNIRIR